MRTRFLPLLALAVLTGVLPTAGVGADAVATGGCLAPPPLSFDDRVVIDPDRAGGEPVSVVAQDGSISVSAHAGTTHIYKDPAAVGGYDDFAVGYTNQTLNWRSDDGGRTWDYVGLGGLNAGPHSATSTGFSDPDYAVDQAGTIYNVEINLVNNAVFSSMDDGQSYTLANPEVAPGDRPWLAANEPGEVFLYINLPKQLWRSTDSGITWSLVGQGAQVAISAKPYTDPLNPDDGLIGPAGGNGIAISGDDGRTWESFQGANLGQSQDFFDVMAVDRAGNAYKVAAGGYNSPNDRTPSGTVTFNYFDREAERWGRTVSIPLPEGAGDALFPWIIAGDDGRVAVVYYYNLAADPNSFFIGAAYTLNGTGSMADCDGDGEREFVAPQFSVADATNGVPVHVGAICLSGTTCNASTNFVNGDRRLGDFFTVNFDADGRLFIASADTTRPSATGGPKPVGNPVFIAAGGDTAPLLERPLETRDTRCLFGTAGTPLCG
jgi:hypothetical protein